MIFKIFLNKKVQKYFDIKQIVLYLCINQTKTVMLSKIICIVFLVAFCAHLLFQQHPPQAVIPAPDQNSICMVP